MVDREKKTDPPKKESFTSRQLCLFQDFLFNTPEERNSLSNTIELWDAVPKYYISKHTQNKLRKNGFLPTIEKNFVFRGQSLSVKVRPGRLTIDGKDKEFYPGVREELRCGTDSCYITQYGKLNTTYCLSIQLDKDTTGNR